MKFSVKQQNALSEQYQCILSCVVLICLFLIISIALTIRNLILACVFNFCVCQIKLGMFGVAVASRCSGFSWFSMPLSSSISDSTSTLQLSLLSFGLSKSPFQFSQFSVCEMLPDTLFSLLSTWWQSIRSIQHTLNGPICSAGRSFEHQSGGKGDHSDNWNVAAPSCWKSDKDASMVTVVF